MAKRLIATLTLLPVMAFAKTVTVNLHLANTSETGQGMHVGTVTFEEYARGGVLITPNLHDLPAGTHGFHIHTNPSCAPKEEDNVMVPALAAGGHFDPDNTGIHLGPYKDGHLGDLPVLVVSNEAKATTPVLAPRLTMDQISGHALMVHAGGDNYSNKPDPMGGGAARIACGVIE